LNQEGANSPTLDETHAPTLESWVGSAAGHADLPIQNLPFGVSLSVAGQPPSITPRRSPMAAIHRFHWTR
jgi:hypothetical protein